MDITDKGRDYSAEENAMTVEDMEKMMYASMDRNSRRALKRSKKKKLKVKKL